MGLTSREVVLAGCGKTISVQQNFDGLHICDKPGLSGPSGQSNATKQTRLALVRRSITVNVGQVPKAAI
jgi:hypothetical protein